MPRRYILTYIRFEDALFAFSVFSNCGIHVIMLQCQGCIYDRFYVAVYTTEFLLDHFMADIPAPYEVLIGWGTLKMIMKSSVVVMSSNMHIKNESELENKLEEMVDTY